MRQRDPSFGDADVSSYFCDGCEQQITSTMYRGHAGEYCSRSCFHRYDSARLRARLRKRTASHEVKTESTVKTKPKVKISPPSKVKTGSEPSEVKLPSRKALRSRRRAAIREILSKLDHAPTIMEVQSQLSPLGLSASIRTIGKDLNACRE